MFSNVAPLDFLKVFTSHPTSSLLLNNDPDFTILEASDSYLKATMTKRENIIGRPLFMVFPDNPEDPNTNGTRNLRASLERVITSSKTDEMPIQKYDIRRPEEEGGFFEERYWKPVNSPVISPDGKVIQIVHTAEDVTALVQMNSDLSSVNRMIDFERSRLYAILGNSPIGIAVARGAELTIDFANAAFRELSFPHSSLDGRSLDQIDCLGQNFKDKAKEVFQSRTRALVNEIELGPDGKCFNFVLAPWKIGSMVDGVIIYAIDVSDFVLARKNFSSLLEHQIELLTQQETVFEQTFHKLINCLSLVHLDAQIIIKEAEKSIVRFHAQQISETFTKISSVIANQNKNSVSVRKVLIAAK